MKITTKTIREAKGVRKLACLTAYDAVTARIADEAGADLILVGDSVGNVSLGFTNTLGVTPPMMAHHIQAVARAKPNAIVVGDLPFGVAADDWTKLLSVCLEFLRSGAEAVKIEGGENLATTVSRLTEAGIPVMGHIGLQPQQVLALGGYRKFGKNQCERKQLLRDAEALSAAGAFCLVAELVEPELAGEISLRTAIPVIGIGSGNDCDGCIAVTHDLLGLSAHYPAFAKPRVELGRLAVSALSEWASEIKKASHCPPLP